MVHMAGRQLWLRRQCLHLRHEILNDAAHALDLLRELIECLSHMGLSATSWRVTSLGNMATSTLDADELDTSPAVLDDRIKYILRKA